MLQDCFLDIMGLLEVLKKRHELEYSIVIYIVLRKFLNRKKITK